MNKKILSKLVFGASLLLFAACSQNEFSDGQSEPLPEGKYPLEIASVTMNVTHSEQPWSANAPQTRVTENTTDGNSSAWTNGDQIGVQIGDNTETGVYTVNVDGSVTSLTSETPLYWKSTASSQSVTAWYPAYEGETVNLADQSNGLAYVLKGVGSGSYQYAVSLTFTHQLAKVRVTFNGDKATGVTGVRLYTYTSCTNTHGTVSTTGATEGWITMKEATYNSTKCYEANVVPNHEITKFKINDAIEGTLTTAVTPQAAKLNGIELSEN